MESGPRPLDAKVSHVLSFVYEPRGPFLEIRREGLRVGEGLLDRGWWIHYKNCGDTPIAILLSFFFTFIQSIYLAIIPRARMGSESVAHEAEGRMGY